MMKKSLTIFLACVLAVLFSSCSFRLSDLTYVQNTLKGLTAESFDVNVIGASFRTNVHSERELRTKELFEKQNPELKVNQIIACKGDKIYLLTWRNEKWSISSIRSNGTDLTVHFERGISAEAIGDQYPDAWYLGDSQTGKPDFSESGTFCYNGKIVMFDQKYVSELDIFTEKVTEYPTEQYAFPENDCPIYISDGELYKASGELIPPTWIAEKSEAFRQILELKDFKLCNENFSALTNLFCSVQQIDKKTYLICEVLDWKGDAYAVVFSYDPLTENVAYLWHQHTRDPVVFSYRLIPVYE